MLESGGRGITVRQHAHRQQQGAGKGRLVTGLRSIVTPSYNQSSFIERTIKSILNQNYPNLEYIIQDGASSDGTVTILENYRSQIDSIESVKDTGQANAINLGFAKSKGEIMAWLNSDDLFLPGALDYVVHYFLNHPQVDAVYGHRILIDENDSEVGRWILPPHDARSATLRLPPPSLPLPCPAGSAHAYWRRGPKWCRQAAFSLLGCCLLSCT